MRLLAGQHDLAQLARQLTSVLGAPPAVSSASEVTWDLASPAANSGDENGKREGGVPAPRLVLGVPRDAAETRHFEERGPGIFEVGFWTESGKGGSVDSPYGRIVWRPLHG